MFNKKEKLLLSVEGMSCEHCVKRVEDEITSLRGVTKAKVNLEKKTAQVEYTPGKVSADDIVNAVNAAGFSAEVKKWTLDLSLE